MATRYETGTRNQVLVDALHVAILSETEMMKGYQYILNKSQSDKKMIEKSKAIIRDYEKLLSTLRSK